MLSRVAALRALGSRAVTRSAMRAMSSTNAASPDVVVNPTVDHVDTPSASKSATTTSHANVNQSSPPSGSGGPSPVQTTAAGDSVAAPALHRLDSVEPEHVPKTRVIDSIWNKLIFNTDLPRAMLFDTLHRSGWLSILDLAGEKLGDKPGLMRDIWQYGELHLWWTTYNRVTWLTSQRKDATDMLEEVFTPELLSDYQALMAKEKSSDTPQQHIIDQIAFPFIRPSDVWLDLAFPDTEDLSNYNPQGTLWQYRVGPLRFLYREPDQESEAQTRGPFSLLRPSDDPTSWWRETEAAHEFVDHLRIQEGNWQRNDVPFRPTIAKLNLRVPFCVSEYAASAPTAHSAALEEARMKFIEASQHADSLFKLQDSDATADKASDATESPEGEVEEEGKGYVEQLRDTMANMNTLHAEYTKLATEAIESRASWHEWTFQYDMTLPLEDRSWKIASMRNNIAGKEEAAKEYLLESESMLQQMMFRNREPLESLTMVGEVGNDL